MFLSASSDGISWCFFSEPFNGCHSVLESTCGTANAGTTRLVCHIFEHPAKCGGKHLEQSQAKGVHLPQAMGWGRGASTERSSTPTMMT